MPDIRPYKINPIASSSPIQYLTDAQINAAFQSYYDNNSKKAQKANRGRYWLVFLCLRYAGARVQDILGHSALTTTAIYLRMSGQEAKSILKEKGLI